jgi:hypothetical protein
MQISFVRRVALVAMLGFIFAAGVSQAVQAQGSSGSVRMKFAKGGWFIGGQAGSGTLSYGGRSYPFNIGGLSVGLTFGGSVTDLRGTARNLRRPSDIEGVYTAVQAGAAAGGGARVITLKNTKGVVLNLQGMQAGLALDLDLSGMAISLK